MGPSFKQPDWLSEQRSQQMVPAQENTSQRITAGQLALEVMHEIRNPLEALGHLTYLTLQASHNAEEVTKYMRMAEEQIATLNRIISQTLGYARSESKPMLSDLVELAEAAIRIHQRTIEAKKIHLLKDFPPGVTAEIRTGEILQVVSNLIVNALDALPAGGKLIIRLRRRNGGIFILISDSGHGIPAQHSRKVFEPFFTTKEESGNGLGLALTKRIVERHGGKIWLRSSVRPSKSGTTFRILLPA
jgi:signal transduction histidine kinase